jgi:hypothetical protein
VLFVMLLASSVYLVRVSYDSRRLFAELDQARNEERALDTEYERLKAERQGQSHAAEGGAPGARQAGHAQRHAGRHAVRDLCACRFGECFGAAR